MTVKNSRRAIAALSLLLAFSTAALFGCGSKGNSFDSASAQEILSQAIKTLSEAKSFETARYFYDEMYDGDKRITVVQESEAKIIREPYTSLSITASTYDRRGEIEKSITEYYEEVKDGEFSFYIRMGTLPDGSSGEYKYGEWEKIGQLDEPESNYRVDIEKKSFEAQLFLLASNIKSFKYAGTVNDAGNPFAIYEGTIDPETAVDAYRIYLRDFYVEGGIYPKLENPTNERLKEEIRSGEYFDLLRGIPRLAFTDSPIPVTVWIDETTTGLKRVEIDYTDVSKAAHDVELNKNSSFTRELSEFTVEKAIRVFEIKSINTLTSVAKPDGIV